MLTEPQHHNGEVGGSPKRRRVLPADVVLDASRRLGIASLAMGIVLLVLIVERFRGYLTSDTWLALDLFSVLVSAALYVVCRYNRLPAHRLMDVALVYELLLAFTLSYMEFSVPGGAMRVREGGISWACLVIVLFPALVPSTPGRALAAGFSAASMGPLAYALALLLHEDPVPMARFDIVMLFFDNYLAGALTIVPSLVFTKLAADVASAREMGSYTLEERLGSGGMGEVWRARHRLLARPAAVKLIRAEALGTDDATGLNVLQRFEREARATSALRSPHTVILYDFGLAEDGTFYYVMELLDGLDVETLVERFGALPPARVVYLLVQACASLEEAHRAGLVHRDVKPANLYVCRLGTEYDWVKILDFGLVKTNDDFAPNAAKLSSTDMIYGTPAYMPPEQARGQVVTPRTDIYALGCVAYYMLTGRMVFESSNTMQILMDHQQTAPPSMSGRINRVIPPELEAIVQQCLQKDPDKRPQSARELSDALLALSLPRPWSAGEAEKWWADNLPEFMPGYSSRPTVRASTT